MNRPHESAAAGPPALDDPPFVVDLTNRQFHLVTIVWGGFKNPIPTLEYIGPLPGNYAVHEAERFRYAERANLTIPLRRSRSSYVSLSSLPKKSGRLDPSS